MAHYTLIARINAGDGKFPFVNVQFSKNHRPIPIEGATYYLRPSNSFKRKPIRIGKDLGVAHTALIGMDYGQPFEAPTAAHADPPSTVPSTTARKTVGDAAREYIERSSKQKSRTTYLGYRAVVNLLDRAETRFACCNPKRNSPIRWQGSSETTSRRERGPTRMSVGRPVPT